MTIPISSGLVSVIHISRVSHIDEIRYFYVQLLTYINRSNGPSSQHMVMMHKRGQETSQLSSCPLAHLHWCWGRLWALSSHPYKLFWPTVHRNIHTLHTERRPSTRPSIDAPSSPPLAPVVVLLAWSSVVVTNGGPCTLLAIQKALLAFDKRLWREHKKRR